MGFLSEWKIKRVDKKATDEFNVFHTVWKDDLDSLNKLIEVFTAASKGEDAVPNSLTQKPGEVTLWTANGGYCFQNIYPNWIGSFALSSMASNSGHTQLRLQ